MASWLDHFIPHLSTPPAPLVPHPAPDHVSVAHMASPPVAFPAAQDHAGVHQTIGAIIGSALARMLPV